MAASNEDSMSETEFEIEWKFNNEVVEARDDLARALKAVVKEEFEIWSEKADEEQNLKEAHLG